MLGGIHRPLSAARFPPSRLISIFPSSPEEEMVPGVPVVGSSAATVYLSPNDKLLENHQLTTGIPALHSHTPKTPCKTPPSHRHYPSASGESAADKTRDLQHIGSRLSQDLTRRSELRQLLTRAAGRRTLETSDVLATPYTSDTTRSCRGVTSHSLAVFCTSACIRTPSTWILLLLGVQVSRRS